MTPDDYFKQLEITILRNQELEKENEELKKENEDLKKRLLYYENPNTPPSARQIEKADKTPTENIPLPKKRGAPIGHKGATRPTKEPENTEEVIADYCEKCNSLNIEKLETCETSIIEDMPPPQKITRKRYNRWKVKCRDCGHQFISKHPECPKTGVFGIYILVYIVMLKFFLRGVIRKIQDFALRYNDLEISPKGIHDILLRVGEACKKDYEDKIQKIRRAKWRYIDETGIKVLGIQYWLWIFRTDTNEVLVVIRKSRGKKVLEEILGKESEGANSADGWRAYNWMKLQRCWAHLLRVVDACIDVSDNGKRLSDDIHSCFKKLREFLDRDSSMVSMADRMEKKDLFEKELDGIIAKYSEFKELKKPLTYLENGRGCWFTCLIYPGMEPTNNLAEQAIREHVIMRKIIGCFRSIKGAENYQYIASLLATARLQGKNGFEELEKVLRQELCLS
ncbi:MAG: IS66 family transposase [Candidatus Methanoperedens sp.]|nr:IS66 family transposase [Candidatus Methanoperedens sp.]